MSLTHRYSYYSEKIGDKTYVTIFVIGSNGSWVIADGGEYRLEGSSDIKHFTSDLDEEPELPAAFHSAIVSYAIAKGYLRPPDLDKNGYGLYIMDYERKKKEFKKWARNSNSQFGQIKPQDY